MNALWQSRTPRERGLIVLAAVVVLGGGSFEFIIEPTIKGRTELSRRLPQLRADSLGLSREIDAARSAREALTARKKPLTETALRESLLTAQLQAKTVQLTGGGADISLSGASAPAVLQWAHQATSVFGVRLHTLDITWRDGAAEARLRLAP